jgi:hypothetical protein
VISTLLVAAHLATGLGALAVAAVTLAIAVPPAVRGGPPPRVYRPLHRAVAAMVGATVLVGGLLYVTQHRPQTGLHLVYAVAALLVMPVARALVRRDPARARAYQLGGTLLLLGVIFRLVTTG